MQESMNNIKRSGRKVSSGFAKKWLRNIFETERGRFFEHSKIFRSGRDINGRFRCSARLFKKQDCLSMYIFCDVQLKFDFGKC